MHWRMRLLLGVLSWMLLPAAFAQPACGPYRVAFYEYGSFYFKDVRGQFTGIDKDIVTELAQRSGCVLEGFLDSRIRIWTQLADGHLDMTVSGIETPDRIQFAQFVHYIRSRNYVITKARAKPVVSSMTAFSNNPRLRVAVVKSFRHGDAADSWLAALRQQGRVDEYGDAEVSAKVFALGRADAFLAEPASWGPLLQHHELQGKVQFNDWFAKDQFDAGLVLSRKRVRPDDAQRMRRAIQSMHDDGTLEAIFRKYMPADVAKRSLL